MVIYSVLFRGAVIYQVPHGAWDASAWIPPLLAIGLSLPVAIHDQFGFWTL